MRTFLIGFMIYYGVGVIATAIATEYVIKSKTRYGYEIVDAIDDYNCLDWYVQIPIVLITALIMVFWLFSNTALVIMYLIKKPKEVAEWVDYNTETIE